MLLFYSLIPSLQKIKLQSLTFACIDYPVSLTSTRKSGEARKNRRSRNFASQFVSQGNVNIRAGKCMFKGSMKV